MGNDLPGQVEECIVPVYLIHFEQPYYHARHYLGYAANLEARIRSHRLGHGAKLLRAVNAAGIAWEVVRVWEGGFDLEQALKSWHNAPHFCPVCQQQAVLASLDEHVRLEVDAAEGCEDRVWVQLWQGLG